MTIPDNKRVTSKELLRSMQIMTLALVTGTLIFAIVVIIINLGGRSATTVNDLALQNIFFGMACVIALICVVRAFFIYREKVALIKKMRTTLPDKLNQYRTSLVLYMALCEFSALFSVIVFFISHNYYALLITAVMLTAMLIRMPQKRKLICELDLGWQEREELE